MISCLLFDVVFKTCCYRGLELPLFFSQVRLKMRVHLVKYSTLHTRFYFISQLAPEHLCFSNVRAFEK